MADGNHCGGKHDPPKRNDEAGLLKYDGASPERPAVVKAAISDAEARPPSGEFHVVPFIERSGGGGRLEM